MEPMDLSTFTKLIEYLQGQSNAIKTAATIVVFLLFLFFAYILWQKTPLRIASVSLERVSIFYVTIEANTYQVGVTARLFNSDTDPRKLSGMTIEPLSFQLGGSGNAQVQKLFISGASAENDDDLVIKPGDYRDFKLLLPLKWVEVINGPKAPDIVFLTPFTFHFESGVRDLTVKAERYGNFDRAVTLDEWKKLLKTSSVLDLDGIAFKRTPKTQIMGTPRDFIVFNPDQSATIDVYGFARTDYKKTPRGVVTMLKGSGEPILDGGWQLMANTYAELLNNPKMLQLYGDIVGRDAVGNVLRVDAGFRAGDMVTFGPFTKQNIPMMFDFIAVPPYVGPPR